MTTDTSLVVLQMVTAPAFKQLMEMAYVPQAGIALNFPIAQIVRQLLTHA